MLRVGAVGSVGIVSRRVGAAAPAPPSTSAVVAPISTVSVSGWSPVGAATLVAAVTDTDSASIAADLNGATVVFALDTPALAALRTGTLYVRHRRVEDS